MSLNNCKFYLNSTIINRISSQLSRQQICKRCETTAATKVPNSQGNLANVVVESKAIRVEKISHAMKSYLDRAKKYDEVLQEARQEFDIGKRHLANMMGWNPETVTQKDIDSAIQYLMPSGLFNPAARPLMRPPDEIFPKRKSAQFDVHGKPHHTLFYTGFPNYFQLMHDIHASCIKLNEYEDKMIAQGVTTPPAEARVDLSASEWITFKDLQLSLLELRLKESQYDYLIAALERLAEHPYSARMKEFFLKYRKELVSVTSQMEVLPLTYDESGRPSMTAEGLRKHCKAQVTVLGNGTGLVNINGKDLSYFEHMKEREQIMFPLQFTGLLGKVDLVATVQGVGISAQAGAVRHGLSLALRSFVDTSTLEEMRLAGLITKDRRVKERKKFGQEGARRKFTWQKR
ncbi:28S ribosomal protein S9, mitochondrial [Halotydeus destructor]|nr:28S ribosomal protein S9, mitochondrial [Halotydeus destructor]